MQEKKLFLLKDFLRLLVSFLIMLGLVICILFPAYIKTLRGIKDFKIKETLHLLEQGRDIIDQQLIKANREIVNLSDEVEIKQLGMLKKPLASKDYGRFISAVKRVQKYEITSDIIVDFMLLFGSNASFMINSEVAVDNIEFYYNNGFVEYRDLPYEHWINRIYSSSGYQSMYGTFLDEADVRVKTRDWSKILTYVKPVSLGKEDDTVMSVVLLDAVKLKNLIKPVNNSNTGFLYVQDCYGNIILRDSYSGEPLKLGAGDVGTFDTIIGGEHKTMLYARSFQTGLTYVVGIPFDWYEGQIHPFKVAFQVFFSIAMLIGILIALFLSYHNIRPIRNLVKRFGAQYSKANARNSFDFLENMLNDLTSFKSSLEEKLKSWQPIVQAGLMERLLNGSLIDYEEIETSNELFSPVPSQFRVIVLETGTGDRNPGASTLEPGLMLTMAEIFKKNTQVFAVHPIGKRSIAVILNASNEDEKSKEEVRERLSLLMNQIHENTGISVLAGVGMKYSDLSSVSDSFMEAKQALLRCKDWNNERVVWYEEIRHNTGSYIFSNEHLQKLKNLIMSGNMMETLQFIEQIFNRSFDNNEFSKEDLAQFYYEIRGVILRIGSEISCDDILKKLPEYETLVLAKDVLESIKEICTLLCERCQRQKDIKANRIMDSILQYIADNYRDPSLSLKKLSDEFGLSDKYISSFFKEHTGTNFSEYLMELRLKEAVRLLQDTDMLLNDITLNVGYLSANTFYKVFRRKYGIAPSEWREKISKKSF